jgi:hypothetical protein
MVMSCSQRENPWALDEGKGLLARSTESGRRDEEGRRKRRGVILEIDDANRGDKFRSGTLRLAVGDQWLWEHVSLEN